MMQRIADAQAERTRELEASSRLEDLRAELYEMRRPRLGNLTATAKKLVVFASAARHLLPADDGAQGSSSTLARSLTLSAGAVACSPAAAASPPSRPPRAPTDEGGDNLRALRAAAPALRSP